MFKLKDVMSKFKCESCKYNYDRWCVKRGFNQRDRSTCVDCPLYIKELDDCYCTTVRICDECPYYEPMEEEVDE